MLVKAGATVREEEMIYKAGVHTVLLYGIESWVVTDAMLKVLEEFHHRVDLMISGMIYW